MAKKSTAGRRGTDPAKSRGAGTAVAPNGATSSTTLPAGPGRERAASGAAPSDALARARLAFAAGNSRAARALAAQILASGPEPERDEAAAIRDRTSPDPRALVTVAVVFLIILFAAWAAIFRAH